VGDRQPGLGVTTAPPQEDIQVIDRRTIQSVVDRRAVGVERRCRDLAAGLSRRDGSQFVYLATIFVCGVLVLVTSIRELNATDFGLHWTIFAALTMVGGFARLRLPNVPASFSISDSFTIGAALLYGPAAGVLTVAIDSLAISAQLARRKLVLRRFLFNATAPPLAMWMAAHVFFLLADVRPLAESVPSLPWLIGPLLVFVGLFFVLNTGLIACAIALERDAAPMDIWRRHFLSLWLSYFGGAVVAALLIALVNSRANDWLVFALVAPIPLILYAAFKNATGRTEDQFAHLEHVNRMYLATIEALATAIEAKDGVTHDHIRRVQRQAVGLARALGVTDDSTIKAIEAAALLHDTGKLAVPEHILNKPGKLNPIELAKMRRHVDVGADILSTIDFPYPVVPIVKSHHEAWDGSGYPQGLSGTDIPIGARILSVVDCFDALTSDRPYRRALSESAAIEILVAHRGTMYDPTVVDTFLRVYRELQPDPVTPAEAIEPPPITCAAAKDEPPAVAASAGSEGSDEIALASFGRLASDSGTAADLMSLAAALLQRDAPGATCAFYAASDDDVLVVSHAVGRLAPALRGFTMGVGVGLSGWVAANRQSIVNSDASLDLSALGVPPGQHLCMSTPLVDRGTFVGVLTLYTDSSLPIPGRQQHLMEALAPHVAYVLKPGSAIVRATTPRPSGARSDQERRTRDRAPATAQ
jgi:putative nucleotidyltransferase with HDIG domain